VKRNGLKELAMTARKHEAGTANGWKRKGRKIVQKRDDMRKLYGVADDILHIDSEG